MQVGGSRALRRNPSPWASILCCSSPPGQPLDLDTPASAMRQPRAPTPFETTPRKQWSSQSSQSTQTSEAKKSCQTAAGFMSSQEAPRIMSRSYANLPSYTPVALSDLPEVPVELSTTSRVGVPSLVVFICFAIFAALAVCIYLMSSESSLFFNSVPRTRTASRASPAEPVVEPLHPEALGVQISVPTFGKLLDEKHLDVAAAWRAIADQESAVDFGRFSIFTVHGLTRPLNATQSWWVFSELDENQDLTLRKAEFFETLNRVKMLSPPSPIV